MEWLLLLLIPFAALTLAVQFLGLWHLWTQRHQATDQWRGLFQERRPRRYPLLYVLIGLSLALGIALGIALGQARHTGQLPALVGWALVAFVGLSILAFPLWLLFGRRSRNEKRH